MKDQKHNQGQENVHQSSAGKSESQSQKSTHSEGPHKTTYQKSGNERETAGKEGSEQADRAGKLKSAQHGREFADLDHDKISKFHEEMDRDEGLKQRFQQDPHGVLNEHGVVLPEGYKATYDHQFTKPADGSKVGMYGYRVGNINFTK